jgi:hypothetical protein
VRTCALTEPKRLEIARIMLLVAKAAHTIDAFTVYAEATDLPS